MIALVAWLGCAVPMILPSHDPTAILATEISPESGPSFEGTTIILVFDGDSSLAPVGAMLDDLHRHITPVQQTYVLSQPGWVLYESLAATLTARGAKVYRSYGPVTGTPVPGTPIVVGIAVQDLELHHWRTEEDEFHLVRTRVTWRLPGATHVDTVMTRVPPERDVFAAAAGQLATALRGRLP